MGYRTLLESFYRDRSSSRFARNESMALERLNAESTFRTGFTTPNGELFLAVPRELSMLSEQVLRHERRISTSMRLLPPVAQAALVRGLVVDEVVSTNDMEGVHSTRRQINDILRSLDDEPERHDDRRFREFAKLYLGISDERRILPTTPEDIRSIYDLVMRGEDLKGNAPDGLLFRKGAVEVIGSGGKVLHEGLFPERDIQDGIERMLGILHSEDIPELYSAIIGHFIFEHIHPFYDGNGRTGRYLLALFLNEPLSLATSLSLSRTIAENRGSYYRSFRDVEHKQSHGELTGFVMGMLNNVRMAQDELDADLTEKRARLDDVTARLKGAKVELGISDKEMGIVHQLVQLDLFAAYPEASVREVADHLDLSTQQTRRYLKRLEGRNAVVTVSQRPLRFALSDQMRERFGLK